MRIFVNGYAYSSGTILALMVDELYMKKCDGLSTMNVILTNDKNNIICDKNYVHSSINIKELKEFRKDEKIIRGIFLRMINKKYDKLKIMKIMCDDVLNHRIVFGFDEMQKITDNQIIEYVGDCE